MSFAYQNLSAVSVIESISPHSPINNQVTVTFNTELDRQAQTHTRTNAYKATLYVLFTVGSTPYKLSLTLSVSDCACYGADLLIPTEGFMQDKIKMFKNKRKQKHY